MIVVVQVLCVCIAWYGYQLGAFASGGAFGLLLTLQAVIINRLAGLDYPIWAKRSVTPPGP